MSVKSITDIYYWFFSTKQIMVKNDYPLELKDVILLFLLQSYDEELKTAANIAYNKKDLVTSLILYRKCFFWYNNIVSCFRVSIDFYLLKQVAPTDLYPYKLHCEFLNGYELNERCYILLQNKVNKSPQELCILAIMYYNGLYVQENKRKGFDLYCQAAKLKYYYGTVNMAHILRKGDVYIKQNLMLARNLYALALYLNNSCARLQEFDDCYPEVLVVNFNINEILEKIEYKTANQ